MNEQARQFAVLVGGVSVVAAAAWYAAVRPLAEALDADRRRLRSDCSEIERAHQTFDSAATEATIARIELHTQEWRSLWSMGNDAAALYERLQSLAHANGVRIERIEPRTSGINLRNRNELHDLKIDAQTTAYKVDLQGEFDQLVGFLDAVQRQTGLSRIDTIRIGPAPIATAPTNLEATITTTHASLTAALAEAHKPEGAR